MDQHENPMIAEGQAQMIRQERIPQEEEREVRPGRCWDCHWVAGERLTFRDSGGNVTATTKETLFCWHPAFAPDDRSLPPSLKGKPPDWCPWEEG